MPPPNDLAMTLLVDASNLVRQFYADGVEHMYPRFGGNFNKFFKPNSKRRVDGDGVNFDCIVGNSNSARVDNTPMGSFPTPRPFSSSRMKARYTNAGGTANDFRRLAIAVRTEDGDLIRKSSDKVSSIDFAQELVDQANGDITETLAISRTLDATAKLAQVNGTPKKNDTLAYSTGAALAATGGARFQISDGSISFFKANLYVDVYSGATNTKRFTVYVTDTQPSDPTGASVGCYGVDANGLPSTSVDVSAMASGDYLYVSNTKDQGLISLGTWFSTPTAGETTFFGLDRTTTAYRHLATTQKAMSGAVFSNQILNTFAIELGYVCEVGNSNAYVMRTTFEIIQKFKDNVGNDTIIQIPTTDPGSKVFAQYGFDGAVYRSESLGRVGLMGDALMKPGSLQLLRLEDWEMLSIGGPTVRWLPGDVGLWKMLPAVSPQTGFTPVYQMHGYMLPCDVCTFPRRQYQATGFSTTV